MNVTAPVAFLALLAADNRSSHHEPDDYQLHTYFRCFDCSETVGFITWCNNPTEDNAPAEGIKKCYYDSGYDACLKTVFGLEYDGSNRVERHCSDEGACRRMGSIMTMKMCITCTGDLCNGNQGTKHGPSMWLVATFMLTVTLKLTFEIR